MWFRNVRLIQTSVDDGVIHHIGNIVIYIYHDEENFSAPLRLFGWTNPPKATIVGKKEINDKTQFFALWSAVTHLRL